LVDESFVGAVEEADVFVVFDLFLLGEGLLVEPAVDAFPPAEVPFPLHDPLRVGIYLRLPGLVLWNQLVL